MYPSSYPSTGLITAEEVKEVEVQVFVNPQTLTLPAHNATLTAYAIPEPEEDNPYNYEWSLISDQSDVVMENVQDNTLTLSLLEEGTYKFKVIVSGGHPPVHGIGFGLSLIHI